MSKHLVPLALLCVCLFTGPAVADDFRPRISQYYDRDYESAYADAAYALGFDVQIVYDETGDTFPGQGVMEVTIYTDGQNEWWPDVRFDWFDQRGRWYFDYLPYPELPPNVPGQSG